MSIGEVKSRFIDDRAVQILGIHEFTRPTTNKKADEGSDWLGDRIKFRERLQAELDGQLDRYIEGRFASKGVPTDLIEGERKSLRLPEIVVNKLVDRLQSMHESLRSAYKRWSLEGVTDSSISASDQTVESLRCKLPFAAMSGIFSWLDAFMSDPVRAAMELKPASEFQTRLIEDNTRPLKKLSDDTITVIR